MTVNVNINTDTLEVATFFALVATAVILLWYTIETYKLRKQAGQQTIKLQQANTLAALTEIHKTLSNDLSRTMRGFLHTRFTRYLGIATSAVLGSQYVISETSLRVSIVKVLSDLNKDLDRLYQFNHALSNAAGDWGFSPLDAVEHVLLDFDILALPLHMRIESAKEIAQAYRPVFERTAPVILPFVAIQRKLRGSTEPGYMKYYLDLLKELKIDVQGVEVS